GDQGRRRGRRDPRLGVSGRRHRGRRGRAHRSDADLTAGAVGLAPRGGGKVRTTFPVSAPPEAWAALADPARLAAVLPGCRSVVRTGDGDGTLQVVTEVAGASVGGLWGGTVAAVGPGAVRVRGSGGPGAVDLIVRADPERTALTVEGTVDGALGTVGSAVLTAAVRRTVEELLAAAAPATLARLHAGDARDTR